MYCVGVGLVFGCWEYEIKSVFKVSDVRGFRVSYDAVRVKYLGLVMMGVG